MTTTKELADLIWVRLPEILGRRVLTLGVALADGGWVRVSPTVAVAAPFVAMSTGGFLGLVRPDPIYTKTVWVLVVLTLIGAIGSSFGTYAWLGYVALDSIVHGRQTDYASARFSGWDSWWRLDVPLLTTYLVLAVAMVAVPIAATGLTLNTSKVFGRKFGANVIVRAGLQGLFVGVGIGLWSHAAAFMVRPLWSFVNAVPPIEAIRPLQTSAKVLGWTSGCAAAARVSIQRLVTPATMRLKRPRLMAEGSTKWPWWLRAVGKAAVITLLMSGLIETQRAAMFVFAVLFTLAGVQQVGLRRLGGYVRFVTSIPIIIRLILVGMTATFLADRLVREAVSKGAVSFVTMLTVFLVSVAIGALLLPLKVSTSPGSKQVNAQTTETPSAL
jgi:hypothetical protein